MVSAYQKSLRLFFFFSFCFFKGRAYWQQKDRFEVEHPVQALLPWRRSIDLETRAPRRAEEMGWAH